MARTKFSELREAVEARPGARERLARAETLGEMRLYDSATPKRSARRSWPAVWT